MTLLSNLHEDMIHDCALDYYGKRLAVNGAPSFTHGKAPSLTPGTRLAPPTRLSKFSKSTARTTACSRHYGVMTVLSGRSLGRTQSSATSSPVPPTTAKSLSGKSGKGNGRSSPSTQTTTLPSTPFHGGRTNWGLSSPAHPLTGKSLFWSLETIALGIPRSSQRM